MRKRESQRRKRRNETLVSTHLFRGNLDCLQRACEVLGWKEALGPKSASRAKVFWLGNHLDSSRFGGAHDFEFIRSRHQRASKFEGSRLACEKDETHRALQLFRCVHGKDALPFVPRSFILPEDAHAFTNALKNSSKRKSGLSGRGVKSTFIVKPSRGSEGDGIILCQRPEDLPHYVLDRHRSWIAQDYIERPLTIDGFKFDLRLYVLVCSVDPLRVYLCSEGMVRLASSQYQPPNASNLREAFIHLTNYSLNKRNKSGYIHTYPCERTNTNTSQQADGSMCCVATSATSGGEGEFGPGLPNHDHESEGGSKRKLSDTLPLICKMAGVDDEALWTSMKDLVAKTMIALQPELALAYRRQFPISVKDHSGNEAKKLCSGHNNRGDSGEDAKGRDEEGSGSEEEGSDSFRCFQIFGFDVMITEDGSPFLLEVNSNPSLMITHEVDPLKGNGAAELSPIDEAIKIRAVSDALRLVTSHHGRLPEDDDPILGCYMPVLTARTSPDYQSLTILDGLRMAYQHLAGVRGDGVSLSQFRRAARKLNVDHTTADLLFTKLCSKHNGGFHNRKMDFGLFTAALIEIVSLKSANCTCYAAAEEKQDGECDLKGLAGLLENAARSLCF